MTPVLLSPPELDGVVARLRAAGCVFAEEEADLLVDAAHSPADLTDLVGRRGAGPPLEQVLGWAEFCGLRIVVEPGVFVPRRRTGLLVREAVALAGPGSVVVDLCCGSGAVAAPVAAPVPAAVDRAAAFDPAAVRCARRNLPPERVHEGDLFEALPPDLRGRVDALVANAPYVPTAAIALMPPEARDHEPTVALDGGEEGVDVHGRIAADALAWLAPAGHLLIETSVGQVGATARLMQRAGMRTRAVRSEDLDATVVIGSRSGPAGPATD